MNIAIYCRVSTEHQIKQGDEGSLDNQVSKCKGYLDYTYKQYNVTVYRDEAKSAKNTNRPQFQRLIADVESGTINVIIISALDRMFRNAIDSLQYVNYFNEKNVKFISLRESFDMSTPAGKMMFTLMSAFAEMERQMTSERLKSAVQENIKKGRRMCGSVPFGYRRGPGLTIEDIPEEQETVRKLFQLYYDMGSFSLVRDELNRLGFQHAIGRGKNRVYGPFKASTISKIIENKFYIGILEVNKAEKHKKQDKLTEYKKYYTTSGGWKPCVDEELFHECNMIAERHKVTRKNSFHFDTVIPYIFSGLVFCKECNSQMVGTSTRKKRKDGSVNYWCYYKCKKCGIIIPSHQTEDAMVNIIDELMKKDKDYLQKAIMQKEEDDKQYQHDVEMRIAKHNKKISKLQKEKDRIITALSNVRNKEIIADLNQQLEKIYANEKLTNDIIWGLNLDLDIAIDYDEVESKIRRNLKKFKDFSMLEPNEKKHLVNKLFKRIDATKENLNVYLYTESSIEFMRQDKQFVQCKDVTGPLGREGREGAVKN